jgi:PAS domain S-box-containing protein
LRWAARSIIDDVETDDLYAPYRHIARAAGYRAAQSTPLVSRDGTPLGMLSTHFRSAHRPAVHELRLLDLYLRQASGFIQRCAAEEALRQNEQRLSLALEAGRMGTWDWNTETGRILWSPSLESIHGLPRNSFDGTFDAYRREIHPEDCGRVMESLSKSLEKGAKHLVQYRIIRPDGSIRWVEGTGSLIRGASGNPTHMIGVCADITERRLADDAIRSLLRISGRLNSTLDVDTLLNILVHEATQLIGATAGVSGLFAEGVMTCRKYFQMGQEIPLHYSWPPMHGLPGWLIVHKVPYITNDAMTDTQIVRELCVQFGVRSALSTPILGSQGEILGFFEIHNKDGGFHESDKEKLLAVAHAASIAIQNALVYRRLQRAEQAVRESERTQRMLAEIGLLASHTGVIGGMDVEEMVQSILEHVAAELDVSQCGFSQVDIDAGLVVTEQAVPGSRSSIRRSVPISEFPLYIIEDALAGRTTVIAESPDNAPAPAQFQGTRLPAGVHAHVNVPLYSNKRWVANLWISSHVPRSWTESELNFLRTIGDRVWQVVEQTRTAASLQESEERFARFMRHLPGLAWIKDLQGGYVFANHAAERAFSTARKDLYGRTDEQIFPPETAAIFIRNDRSALSNESGIQTIETLEHADGIHHSLVHKFPILGPGGRVALVGGIAIDISERIRFEEALRESEQRYRAVVESQAEMVCRFHSDGTILFVNGAYARARGEVPESLIGRNFWEFVADDERAAVRAMLDRLTPEAPEIRIENRFKAIGGDRWTLWTNRALTFDSNGRFLEAQSAGIDITDRKRAEQALERSNERLRCANVDLEQFAYSASHDLKEPIRNIAIFSEILAARYESALDEKGIELLSFLSTSAKRMDLLVRDLLVYTQTANVEPEITETADSAVALNKALADLEAVIRESGAQVSFDALPNVRIREVQLQQLFQNLLSNAIKYCRDGESPRIVVTSERKGPDWQFSVRDNGIGIPQEYRERVFGIFKRLHTIEKYSGTGIGLAICQRIVERNGGRIWVESGGAGTGSTFYFTVPAEGA